VKNGLRFSIINYSAKRRYEVATPNFTPNYFEHFEGKTFYLGFARRRRPSCNILVSEVTRYVV
jgi:hypothetical protein